MFFILLSFVLKGMSFTVGLNIWSYFVFRSGFRLVLDVQSVLFTLIIWIVSWSIILFSENYMNSEIYIYNFVFLLLMFIFFMVVLVMSRNFLILLIGWEGVRVISYLLISWWSMRYLAVNIGIQAVLFNRIGDFGLLLIIFTRLVYGFGPVINRYVGKNLFIVFLLFGVIAKSSQIFFHPWLPNAIEGPTPVSSLLHSSTMVVARVYLLLRLSDFYMFSYLITYVRALTILIGGLFSVSQFDFKKIVAYSTTSQLRFIFVLIGLGLKQICLLYVCIHAFFKAILFLISGAFIHGVNSVQDFRIMKMTTFINESFTYFFAFGSFVMMGFPFMSAFYMKDIIVDYTSVTFFNVILIILLFLGLMTTCIYSLRIIFYMLRHLYLNLTKNNRIENIVIRYYYVRLLVLSLVSGLLLFYFYGPNVEFLVFLGDKLKPILFILFSAVIVILAILRPNFHILYIRKYMLFYNPTLFKKISKLIDVFSWFWLLVDYFFMELLFSMFLKKYTLINSKYIYLFTGIIFVVFLFIIN